MNSHMDKVFKDKLGDYQANPPEGIWTGIKAGLVNKPRRKILIPLWQAAAGMALVITAGSLFYFLNRPSQILLSDEFMVVPHTIQTPSPAGKTSPQKNANLQSEAVLSEAGRAAVDKAFAPKVEKGSSKTVNLLRTPEAEPIVMSQNIQDASRGNDDSGKGFSSRFSGESMPDAYLPILRSDKIPRDKKTLVASWEMLTAASDFPGEETRSADRLLLTAQVSPTYAYRDIGTLGNGDPGQFNEFESGRISYSGGLQFGFKTSERLSVHTGIMYSKMGYNINQVGSYNISKASSSDEIVSAPVKQSTVYEVRNSIGTISQGSASGDFIGSNEARTDDYAYFADAAIGASPNMQTEVVGKIEQFFQYLELPFLVRYKIVDHKLGVNLLGGVSTNILVGNKARFITEEQVSTTGTSENVRSFNYMGNMGVGFDYKLSKNLVFTMEPQFKYFLNSINQSSLIANRPYMFGMFTGVKFVW